ncbi:hypothetical protein SeLEV6574_g03499 [Synchytrium endobioticum]|uniref:Uncharacterized protein n=1 Tax=Synchytrium endobioticum TaxID=286115 RepID=A0A507D3C5_9FUNG|nr:hypothetical protein SeLEV6574_g03499 [Synchytrium endobioticum]
MSKLIFIFLLIIGVYYRGTSADLTDRLEANLAAERAKVIKEVADIKTRRRVYDVHYALYITSNRGVGKFIRTHFPPYEYHEGDEREPQVYKYLGYISVAWINVLYIMILNIYKYHDLYYPNEPLFSRTRYELLQRLNMLESTPRSMLPEYDENLTLDMAVLKDDGMGFISDAKDPYVNLMSEMEKFKDVITSEAKKLLVYVKSRVPPLTSRHLDWILGDFALNGNIQVLIKNLVRLITKAEMDEMIKSLANSFGRISSSDTSLEYLILRNDYNEVLNRAEKYAKARETVALDISDHDATSALVYDIAALIRSMDLMLFGDFASERGKALDIEIKQKRETGYVEISDCLLKKHQLKHMTELDAFLVDDQEPHHQQNGIECVGNAPSAESITASDADISDYHAAQRDLVTDNIMHQPVGGIDPPNRGSTHAGRLDGPGSLGLGNPGGSRSDRDSTGSSSRIGI